MKNITHAINTFKIFIIFIYLSFFYLKCENFFTLTLQYHDSKKVSQKWNLDDINLIAPLRDINNDDLIKSQEHTLALANDQCHITHEYLKNLITGNFINGSIRTYLSDYNYFVGSEKNITVPYDKNYEPFPTSLQYKVFKDNEDFFRINLRYGPSSLQNILKTFLFYDYSKKNSESQKRPVFETSTIDLSTAQNGSQSQLSIKSLYLIDYEMFKSLNKEFCKKVTWLKLNDCFLFDLKLSRLFEYFPNLHKLSIKNTFIKSITDQDIDQLEIICNRYQLETKKNLNNFWADFLEKESRKYMQLYSLKFSVQKPNDIIIQKITKYLKEKLHYSFILDLNGCLIDQNCFEPLKNNNDQKIYKKTLLIKGIKTSNQGSSSFQKFIFR